MKNITKEQPIISIITVNYKTDELLLDLLNNLIPDPQIEVIIVDNSPENTLEKKIPKRSDIQYYFSGSNLGFSGGNNLGISKAHAEWYFLLNSDTIANTKDIIQLFETTKKEGFVVSCPKLVQPNGVIQNNVGEFSKLFKNPIDYLFARPKFTDCSRIKSNISVDLLTGAAMLIHKSVFEKVGLLDDKNFFMYFEDIDFSYRLYKSRIKVLYCPSVTIIHLGGASSDQDSRQKNKNYQHGLNTYLKKHRGHVINFFNSIFHFIS